MQSAFDMTVEWAFDRYSFGRPLASYQALKHRFADMKTWLEGGHAISDVACAAVQANAADAGRARERRQGVHRGLRRRAHPGLRAAPRRHRRHLRARPPPVPPPAHGQPVAVRHAGRAPAAHRRPARSPQRGRGVSALRAEEDRGTAEMEDLESFRQRARAFIRANLRPLDRRTAVAPATTAATTRRPAGRDRPRARAAAHALRRRAGRDLRSRGLRRSGPHAGPPEGVQRGDRRLRVPRAHPGADLLARARRCFLDFGTEEQKLRHIPAILRARRCGCSSSPSRAAAPTSPARSPPRSATATSGSLNGSKVWTTGAWWSDWGLCLARTNWDVPKHRGLTVFMLPIHQPGIEVHRIEMLNGSREFCQEFLTDVRDPRHRPGRRGRRRLDRRAPAGCSTSGCSSTRPT